MSFFNMQGVFYPIMSLFNFL